jgi:hypothetical protein
MGRLILRDAARRAAPQDEGGALARRVPYQRMMRALMEAYAERQDK